ncbi:MAG: TonB-dependent receptor [Gammaproteobacteria bacterium]
MTIRRLLYSLICPCLLLALSLTPPGIHAAARCATGIARAVSIQGVLDVRFAGETDWQAATRNQEYCPGDALRTGASSRAAIQLYPETVIRLDQSSSMVFTPAETTAGSTWLELLKGAAHLISRDPRSLKVITPFANAAIEGTEFLVEVKTNRTGVTVYEGRVRVASAEGDVAVADGEQAIAQPGTVPFKQVLVHPRDAVQWTLYYPPVLAGGSTMLQQAQQALAVGRIDAARGLLDMLLQQDPGNSDALALQSIIALTLNDKESALALATRAVTAAPDSATARIALSYAQQAYFDLSAALASLQTATRNEPDNALARARLAELWLSTGDLDKGLAAAEHAVALDAELAHAHTMLGFAWLTEIQVAEAMAAFEKAITLDQAAPLPRLGLGLAKIRRGELKAGREEIEFAVMLDPGNSLLRSYMGKAYYEEKRDRLAGTQYQMARELDPNDPTPWFYDAIRKQTENRPVEALHDLQTSIKLNDNRAVYRSRLELDSDLATRSASIARIYRDLGFEQRALVEGWQSVNTDPTNFSAHRLLADSYSSQPRHEVARVSELLQSQLLQPLSLTPVQPQLAATDLLILESAGPSDAAFLEFNPLFTRNRLALQANALAGGNDTLGDDLVHSGVHDNWSWSAGQFHYETDGFQDNGDQNLDGYNLFVQTAVSYKTSVQAEVRHFDSDGGDPQLHIDPDLVKTDERRNADTDIARLGLNHKFTPRSEIIASYIHQDHHEKLKSGIASLYTADLDGPYDGYVAEVQHLWRSRSLNLISGIGYSDADRKADSTFSDNSFMGVVFPFSDINSSEDDDIRYTNAYIYSYYQPLDNLTVTLGGSYDDFEDKKRISKVTNLDPFTPDDDPIQITSMDKLKHDISRFNPKLGLSWEFIPDTTLRAAAFRVVTHSLISSQTVEPTQVAGFNQFYDDADGTVSKRYGVALDHVIGPDMAAGLEYSRRDLEVPHTLTSAVPPEVTESDWEERFGRAYFLWTPHPRLSVGAEYRYERFARDNEYTGELEATRVRTNKFPLSLNYFHPRGYIAKLKATYFDQTGDFLLQPGSTATEKQDNNFWIVDTALGYRLPKRRGLVSIGVSNLFDESFNFADTDPFNPRIYPERLVYGRVTLAF